VSVLHTRASTFTQAIAWVPNDEPPLSYFLYDVWARLTGPYPLLMRALPALISLLGYAFTYRLGRKLGGQRAALLAPLVYAAFAYSIITDVKLRSYFLIIALTPACLWLTIRYFDRPSFRRALPPAVVISLMFYTTYTSAFLFLAVGFYTLVMYGRRIWRWIVPVLIAGVLVLPLALSRIGLAYMTATARAPWQPYLDSMGGIFRKFTQSYSSLWIAALLVALALMLIRRPFPLRRLLGFGFWIVGIPTLMYLLLDPRFTYADSGRYLVWIMCGLALVVTLGFINLPRPIYAIACAGFAVLTLLPVSTTGGYFAFPYRQDFEWLKQNVQAGDVFMVDPRCKCPFERELNYYIWLYFPTNGLDYVSNPGDARRVWYLTGTRKADPTTLASVKQGRFESSFVGPPELKFQLYEGPPDPVGIAYDNGLRFHGYDIIEPINKTPLFGMPDLFEQQIIQLKLWWSVDQPLDRDYDVSLYLTANGNPTRIYDQAHGPAEMAANYMAGSTSQWKPGRIYADLYSLRLPAIPWFDDPIRNQVFLEITEPDNHTRVHADGSDDGTDEDGLKPLFSLRENPW
jgi:hypothetical protein